MTNNKIHWENVYASKAENEVSWFQPYPKTSVDFVDLFDLPLNANILDVGGGDSHFVDALLERGYRNIFVLDISANALERAKKRLGKKAELVNWIVCDINEFNPPVNFDLWHDRAAFHFLTEEKNVSRYVSVAEHHINKGGYLVIGTFSESGPKKCSGLNITQYSESNISSKFEKGFDKVKCISEEHRTPFDTVQNFLFCGFKKK